MSASRSARASTPPGRLASANTAIDLFAARDEDAAWEICSELDRMNVERQQIEIQVRESAEAQIRGGERILILAGEGWHRGVLGLTAGRIAQRYHRPTLVMTIEGDLCVGSGRSIPTIDLHGELDAVHELFTHFGGHEFACGFSFEAKNLDALRRRLHERFETFRRGGLPPRSARRRRADPRRDRRRVHRRARDAPTLRRRQRRSRSSSSTTSRVTGTRTFAEDCCELTLEDATGRGGGRALAEREGVARADEWRTGRSAGQDRAGSILRGQARSGRCADDRRCRRYAARMMTRTMTRR